MRGIAVFMLSFALVSGADASSIVRLTGKPATDPSIVTLGDVGKTNSSIVTVGAASGKTASPSLLVLGDPAVNAEKVAAIPAGRQPPRGGGVVVIRAGVVGGASAIPVATAVAAPAAKSASAAGGAGNNGKAPTLRDAMTQAGQAPAIAQ